MLGEACRLLFEIAGIADADRIDMLKSDLGPSPAVTHR